MKHFRIKVCGITRLSDALLANELGADMLGFVFYKKSPRYLSTTKAKKLIDNLPPTIDKVGVMVEPSVKDAVNTAKRLNLDYVQLHGKISPTLISALHKINIKVIRSFPVQNLNSYKDIYKSKADLIHLDNKTSKSPGGTGKQFNWGIKPPKTMKNLVLAGGINIKNMDDGIRIFRPLVIDINSGVETRPGIKSAVKLKQFFKFCNKLRYGTKA